VTAAGAPQGARPVYRIVAIPGDGVGPDVLAAGRRVVDAAGERAGFSVDWHSILVGGAAIDTYGVAILPEDVDACRAADAVFLGAVGGPRWDDPAARVRPEQALFTLRGGLGLFANLRPVTVHPALAESSPIKSALLADVDMLIVRELTGGLYFGARTEAAGPVGSRWAEDALPYAEDEVARIVRLAFELARARRKKVTSVDKANVLATSRLWRTVAGEVAAGYPDVTLENRLVDATAMQIVRWPAGFDVIVTENLFGDILSDEASVLAGSLGMLPSASVGALRTSHGLLGLYEPIHGSAPDIAGKDIANPIGTIMSAAMMLRWSFGLEAAAAAIEDAVSRALYDGIRTPDIMPADPERAAEVQTVGTVGMTDAIVARLDMRAGSAATGSIGQAALNPGAA
jgi:3-isopropylmalate dehydrogenase